MDKRSRGRIAAATLTVFILTLGLAAAVNASWVPSLFPPSPNALKTPMYILSLPNSPPKAGVIPPDENYKGITGIVLTSLTWEVTECPGVNLDLLCMISLNMSSSRASNVFITQASLSSNLRQNLGPGYIYFINQKGTLFLTVKMNEVKVVSYTMAGKAGSGPNDILVLSFMDFILISPGVTTTSSTSTTSTTIANGTEVTATTATTTFTFGSATT